MSFSSISSYKDLLAFLENDLTKPLNEAATNADLVEILSSASYKTGLEEDLRLFLKHPNFDMNIIHYFSDYLLPELNWLMFHIVEGRKVYTDFLLHFVGYAREDDVEIWELLIQQFKDGIISGSQVDVMWHQTCKRYRHQMVKCVVDTNFSLSFPIHLWIEYYEHFMSLGPEHLDNSEDIYPSNECVKILRRAFLNYVGEDVSETHFKDVPLKWLVDLVESFRVEELKA